MKVFGHIKNSLIFFIIALAIMSTGVLADSPNYDILTVEVNDLLAYSSDGDATISSLDVERGETLEIEVTIQGDINMTGEFLDDVIVEAKVIGYEFGSISDTSGPFSVEAGNTYKKTLTLQIPYDIDASEQYTLRIEVADPLDEEQVEFDLHIDEQRHDLNIFDVLLNPSSTIEAGHPVFVTVRLENLGEKQEEDIKVTASIPELGVSAVNFIDELVTQIDEEEEQFKDDEESSKQLDLLLRIPEDAQTGTYEVRIDVEYNRGHSFLTESLSINVNGKIEEKGVQTIVNSDSSSKATEVDGEVTYKVMIANLGDEAGIYSVQVDGVATWGEVSVSPGFLPVAADATGEVLISVIPFDTDRDATHTWVARVIQGTDVISELSFTTKVDVPEAPVVDDASTPGDTVKTVLAVIFGILVIVLIILALIIAFKRMNPDEDEKGDEPHSTLVEGQTYYYYPKY